jgi:hypothetical protein
VKDDVQHNHPKVQELRNLSRWSDGHFWVSPEQHGNLVRMITEIESLRTDTNHIFCRLLYLKTRSTGFLSPPAPYDRPRADPSV